MLQDFTWGRRVDSVAFKVACLHPPNIDDRSRLISARGPAARLLFASVVAIHFCSTAAPAAEVCRFSGTTDYSGHVAVTTRVAASGGVTQVDVAATFYSSAMFWFGMHYLVEEVSSWRDGQLQGVAVNTRTSLASTLFGSYGTTSNAERTASGLTVFKLRTSPTFSAGIRASFSIGIRRHSVSHG
jgi:hypothetical protein